MKTIFLGLLLLQGTPAGVVTGIVRSTTGSPAAGVRVYAMVHDTNDGGNTVLESIGQTDESGRYRLEIPAGRYYVAAGSLEMPTYFPGTTDVTAAQVISITSTAVLDAIDISGFVPATRVGPPGIRTLPTGSTGVLSGVVRLSDGSPAAGIPVTAIPSSSVRPASVISAFVRSVAGAGPGGAPLICQMTGSSATGGPAGQASGPSLSCVASGQTDSNGRYRLTSVSPGTYYIVAGFRDSPTMYPGTTQLISATTITTSPTTNLNTLDFTISLRQKETTVRGRVFGAASLPVGGATLLLETTNTAAGLFALLPSQQTQEAVSAPDGSFQFPHVSPGNYAVHARLPGASPLVRNILVRDEPINDLQFAFPVAVVSGQVLLEDGNTLPEASVVSEVVVVTVNNPNRVETSTLRVDSAGKFSRLLEAKEYRFYVRVLPDGYTIKSITSGEMDLLNGPLKIDGTAPVRVDVRLSKQSASGASVIGRILDSVTGAPSSAPQVELCCIADGPAERFSTPLGADGSFKFSSVPPGRYTAEVPTRAALLLVEHSINVGTEDVSDIKLASARELIPVPIQIIVESGNLAARSGVSVDLIGTSAVPVPARFDEDATGRIWAPRGDRYAIRVSNVPNGYMVKSIISGANELRTGDRLSVTSDNVPVVVVTIARSP